MFRRREARILVDHHARADDRMPVEAGAEQLAELRPGFQRGQPDVRRHETFAVVSHERQEVGLLLLVERHLPVPHEEDRVDVVQIRSAARRLAGGLLWRLRDDVGVGPDIGVVGARLIPQPLDHRERVRDGVVLRLPVAGVRPRQNRLAHPRCAPTRTPAAALSTACPLPAATPGHPAAWRAPAAGLSPAVPRPRSPRRRTPFEFCAWESLS